MVAQRRAAGINGLVEHFADRRHQPVRAFSDDRGRGSPGRNAGAKQALARVNVAHARDHALVEYRRFYRRTAPRELSRQVVTREALFERLGPELGQHWVDG